MRNGGKKKGRREREGGMEVKKKGRREGEEDL